MLAAFYDSDLSAAENAPVEIAMVAADSYVALETVVVFHEGSTLLIVFNASGCWIIATSRQQFELAKGRQVAVVTHYDGRMRISVAFTALGAECQTTTCSIVYIRHCDCML